MSPKNIRSFLRVIAPLCLCVTMPAAVFAQSGDQKRGITPEDYYRLEFLSDPRISPDGKSVAYVLTTVDEKQNRRVSNISLVSIDGGPPRRLTNSSQSSSSPRWSPDGQYLAFLSSRPGDGVPDTGGARTGGSAASPQAVSQTSLTSLKSPAAPGAAGISSAMATASSDAPWKQVYLLSMHGGEALRLTSLTNGVSSFQWSPDGTRLVALGRTDSNAGNATISKRSDVRHYRHLSYKFNDTGWFDERRSHIWVIEVPTGRAQQITTGDDWNDSDPQWSPDGNRIAFVSDRTGKAFDESRNTDVWVISSKGGPLTRISDHEEADESPRWSRDGKTIAFIGRVKERDHPKIWLAPSTGGVASILATDNLDLVPSNLTWASNLQALYFEAGIAGENHIFRIDIGKRTLSQVTSGPRALHSADINDSSNVMVYAANDFKHADDLYVSELSGHGERKITHLNEALWKTLQLQDVERFSFKGADNWDIDGFLVKPIGWREGKKSPMILSVHGGPAGMYGVDWYQEFQVYAAKGWAVLYTNPRGSTGYGQRFERGIENEWGRNDYTDIMNGVESVLKRNSWIDTERLGVTGGSYGGYMVNWIVGHTNIFKAAVTLRSVSNFVSDEGTRDGAYGHRPDFGGDLFNKFELYWERSPLKYAMNVRTPVLVLHSDNDYRVPLEQGEQWFRALRHFGVTSEFVIFPRENHNLTRTGEPKHLVESLNWQIYWFDRFLNKNKEAIAPDR